MNRELHPKLTAEQTGKTVTYFLKDGATWNCTENDLIEYIEKNNLNVDEIFSHNEDPEGQANPAYDVMAIVTKDPQDILTDDWEMITIQYYKDKFRLR